MASPIIASEYRMAGNVALMLVSADPSAGAGVAAEVGTIALRTDSAQVWQKTSAPDTGWAQLGVGGGGGSGDVVGPASATDNAAARYDSTTGKLLQDGPVTIDDTGNVSGVAELSLSSGLLMAVGEQIQFDTDGSGTCTLEGVSGTEAKLEANLTCDGIRVGAGAFRNPSADGSKLDAIEAAADVTDATNVAAAGALMSGTAAHADLQSIGADDHHAESHSVASHSDTTATGSELDELTGGGATALHSHAGGSGDVVGPASATDNALPRYDSTTGKLIQGSSVIVDDSNNVSGLGTVGCGTVTTSGDIAGLGTSNKVTGTRGFMLDLSGDSTKGSAGEHIYSSADDLIEVRSGGTTEFYSAGTLRVQLGAAATFYGSTTVRDNYQARFGSSTDATIGWRTQQTPNSFVIGLGTQSNGLIICEKGDEAYDFAHALQANPTLWIQSATQSATQWLSLAHDQTDGVIDCGTGTLNLGGTANVNFAGASRTASTVTHDAYVELEVAGTLYKFMLGS